MSKFRDRLGREWSLEITMGAAAQVEADTGIDLLKWADDPKSPADHRTIFRIIGSLLVEQIAAAGLSARQFADGFDGGAMEDALAALFEAILFFSQPRKVARAALPKMRQVREAIESETAARIEAQDFSTLAGLTPGSSASTPGP